MYFVLLCLCRLILFFFFNDTATTEIYTLSLHDALPILSQHRPHPHGPRHPRQLLHRRPRPSRPPPRQPQCQPGPAAPRQDGRLLGERPGHYLVATGDLNVDYTADARVRADGFPADALHGLGIPSYAALPMADLLPTHPGSGRYIDYVFLDRRTYGERAAFVSH